MKRIKWYFQAAICIAIASAFVPANKEKTEPDKKQTAYYWFFVSGTTPTTYDGNFVTKTVEMGPTYSDYNDQTSVRCRNGYLAAKLNFNGAVP
ncbi:MAG: hypothetical protein WDO71_28470 [Bacteroidota bacterium]